MAAKSAPWVGVGRGAWRGGGDEYLVEEDKDVRVLENPCPVFFEGDLAGAVGVGRLEEVLDQSLRLLLV